MRNPRTWLLLLLVALLPIRAVMAGSMLCLPQTSDGRGSLAGHHDVRVLDVRVLSPVEDHHARHPPSVHDHTRHGSAGHDRQDHHAHPVAVAPGDGPSPAADSDCNLCAGFCSLTPLASTPPDLRHPRAQSALYPADSAAAPSHVSDGQKRPPRTI